MTADRWMNPDDFGIQHAENKLEALLQQHGRNPSEFNPYERRCHAECYGDLLSQVHAVVDKAEHGNRTLYLIKWKACYTCESNIPDKSWIPASLKLNPDCRRSQRLQNNTQDSREKYEKIMAVVNLEW